VTYNLRDGLEAALPAIPPAANEIVREYRPGSPDQQSLSTALEWLRANRLEIPSIIDGQAVRTGNLEPARIPHDHRHVLADVHLAGSAETHLAIDAACRTAREWSRVPWTVRAAIFLRAAELLSGPWRDRLNAATMLGQSKTVHQSEIDAAAELIDFWRFNVTYMSRLYSEQPQSDSHAWNRVDYRPLEGYVLAITPFNFTAIAGNLATAPVLLGNTVVWKPAATAKVAAYLIMQILREAGLPDGVINLIYGDGQSISDIALSDERLGGVNFTGSTAVFNGMLSAIGARAGRYRNYPRVVGETGGKNFVVAHSSADVGALATAILRGGFEYQGQKCSAASRVFIPESIWPAVRERLCDDVRSIRVGDVADFKTFMGAVIDEKAWNRHVAVIEEVRHAANSTILVGGTADMSRGYFVDPTIVLTSDLESRVMQEEIFGPVVAIATYRDSAYEETLRAIDTMSSYGLTGSIFSTDRAAIESGATILRNAAGNLYINDKPTGAVVGQQPFGGGRASGTNDKAGSVWNLVRWVSPRTVKETFNPATNYGYPSML
jgi:1-pyrroline-5-carboxylate dehydrogenase